MTYNTHRNTIVAVLAVFISLAAVVAPSVQLEAAEDSTYFTWTLNYDYSQMNVRDGQPLTYGEGMDGMVPITNTRTSVGTVTNIGSWDFDTNPLLKLCYYAVFDPSTGDCLGRLDTDNLARYEDGTSAASDIKTNNVLFCIPTIYWKSTDTTLTISNDPDSGGVAYAHTIDGRVYDYLGIGVYEASYDGTYLLSASGAMPDEGSIGPSLAQVADRTIVADGDANLWNLYQWNLYRYICFFAMESFDSDSFGFGDAGASTTGVTDSMGPYAGSTSYSNNGPVKFFIERAWGGVGEILGDTYFTTDWTIVAGQNSTPGWGTSDKEVVCDGPGFSNGYISTIWTDAKAWGLPDGNSGNWYNGMHDYVWGGYAQILDAVIVGGGYAKAGGGYEMGINCLDLSTAMNTGADSIGSRISYVFGHHSLNHHGGGRFYCSCPSRSDEDGLRLRGMVHIPDGRHQVGLQPDRVLEHDAVRPLGREAGVHNRSDGERPGKGSDGFSRNRRLRRNDIRGLHLSPMGLRRRSYLVRTRHNSLLHAARDIHRHADGVQPERDRLDRIPHRSARDCGWGGE